MSSSDSPDIHVTQVVPSLSIGGQEVVVCNLLEAYKARGIEQSVLVFEPGGELTAKVNTLGVRLIELTKNPGIDLRLIVNMYRQFRRIKPSVVHAHNFLAAFYSGLAARPQGIPMVLTRHGTGIDYAARFRSGWLAARTSSRIVGVSEKVASQVVREHKVPSSKISVVQNGVNPESFKPDALRRKHKRATLGIAEGETAFITIGRLVEEKDYPVLLKAAASLNRQGYNLRVLFAGDGPERNRLKSISSELGLAGRAVFLGTRHDIPGLLNAADVFCLSSYTEGSPMSIIEAMASGLPVVATSCGGVAELVNDGQTGYLIPVKDHQALATAMARLVNDSSLVSNLGANARKIQMKNFSISAMADAYLAIYRQVLD